MLKIKNPDDIKGMNFVDGRFVLRRVEEHDDRYRFGIKWGRWACVVVYRKPKWDVAQNANMYRVDNGRFKEHWVSAKWFGKIPNAQFTFTEALKDF